MLHDVVAKGDDDIDRHDTRWATYRLAIVVVGILGGVALCIPLASILAGQDTRVTVNAVLSFSLAATVSLAFTSVGWAASARTKRRLVRKVSRLETENRELRDTVRRLESGQPALEDLGDDEGGDS